MDTEEASYNIHHINPGGRVDESHGAQSSLAL